MEEREKRGREREEGGEREGRRGEERELVFNFYPLFHFTSHLTNIQLTLRRKIIVRQPTDRLSREIKRSSISEICSTKHKFWHIIWYNWECLCDIIFIVKRREEKRREEKRREERRERREKREERRESDRMERKEGCIHVPRANGNNTQTLVACHQVSFLACISGLLNFYPLRYSPLLLVLQRCIWK
jgi:hypothetical protein